MKTRGGPTPPLDFKLSYQQTARSCAIALGSVHKYLALAKTVGIGWQQRDGWTNEQLNAALFPAKPAIIASSTAAAKQQQQQALPDFNHIHEKLRSNENVTLMLLWAEYCEANGHKIVYSYSRYCDYQRWRLKLDVVPRQEHTPGGKMFVDWAGSTIPVYDRHTGQVWQAALFVSALGATSYTWAEATHDQQMDSWLRAHVHAFEHFAGTPVLVS